VIQRIKTNSQLIPFLCEKIEENRIKVDIDDTLNTEQYVIVKVDDYFNKLHLKETPKSIDFLVSVDCESNSYVLYLLELKDINSPKRLNINGIYEKFNNTFNDFMSDKFSFIFMDNRYEFLEINLYFVSDPYGIQRKYPDYQTSKEDRIKRRLKRDTLKVDAFSLLPPLRFRDKYYEIKYDFPPNPIITRSTKK
jgi:hypothetical protein